MEARTELPVSVVVNPTDWQNPTPRAAVAQLDRASGFEPEGREFESLRPRHSPIVYAKP